MSGKLGISGIITCVKPRIRLTRSFDQKHHAYLGYVLVLNAKVDGGSRDEVRVAVGQKTHEKHQFRSNDEISAEAHPVVNWELEWADFYKVSKLRLIERDEADNIVIAPPLTEYRARGHVRLDSRTYEAKCKECIWGLVMPVEIIIDHWNPSVKKHRFETHCYGPRDCKNYKAGKPYRVPGRRGMSWTDDDIEREQSGEY